jgi:hypothetical protein
MSSATSHEPETLKEIDSAVDEIFAFLLRLKEKVPLNRFILNLNRSFGCPSINDNYVDPIVGIYIEYRLKRAIAIHGFGTLYSKERPHWQLGWPEPHFYISHAYYCRATFTEGSGI